MPSRRQISRTDRIHHRRNASGDNRTTGGFFIAKGSKRELLDSVDPPPIGLRSQTGHLLLISKTASLLFLSPNSHRETVSAPAP